MFRIALTWTSALTVSLVLLGANRASAEPPGVAYYTAPPPVNCYSPPIVYAPPAPSVSYYYAPSVSYYPPAPRVSYYAPYVTYYPPSVSYYPPAVSYYAAPGAVTTTRYGLFGRPWVSTTYYAPGYIGR